MDLDPMIRFTGLIGVVTGIISIIMFTWGCWLIFRVWLGIQKPPVIEKSQKPLTIGQSQKPLTIGHDFLLFLLFCFLFCCSLLAAGLGGFIWNALNATFGQRVYLGGTSGEPHGWAAFIWPIVTNAPAAIILVILAHLAQIRIRGQLLLYGVFLFIGLPLGSIIFYDYPGFRGFLHDELYLVLIWSFLLSVLGFLSMEFMKIIVARIKDFRSMGLMKIIVTVIRDLGEDFGTLLIQVGLCVLFTTLFVVCFLLVFGDKFADARGIVAGLALRMTLFFGLLLGTNEDRLNPIEIFRAMTWPLRPRSPSVVPEPPVDSPAPRPSSS